ncbi:MAG: phage portal protein family protein [Planctomycetaceae bacterium]
MTDPRHLPAKVLQQSQKDPAEGIVGATIGFGQEFLPHIHTIGGRRGIVSQSYLNIDEALRDSRENAEKMRADCAIMECLEARQRATALLNWHIEPEDKNNAEEVAMCTALSDIVGATPRFTEFRRCLLEAIWFGRNANAIRYLPAMVKGQYRTVAKHWSPRHGDKLVFRYDDGTYTADPEQVGIRVSSSWQGARSYQDPKTGEMVKQIQPTEQGLVYWLTPWQRKTLALHRHQIEDGPYHDPLMAGRINGVGVRDRIYWTWYAMVECLQRVVEYLDRAAFGIEIWPYQAGNPQSERDTRSAAHNAMGGGRTIILAPLPPDEQPERFMPQLIEPGLAGVSTTIDIIRTYFGHKIKRYIMGQTLTSEADATGMGSGVADAHMATFADIVAYDAMNLEETVTTDFVRTLQIANFPKTWRMQPKFRIDTESPNIQAKMQSYSEAYKMGLRIKASEVYDTIGASMPDANDEVLQMAQAMAGTGNSQPIGAAKPAVIDLDKMTKQVMGHIQSSDAARFAEGIVS